MGTSSSSCCDQEGDLPALPVEEIGAAQPGDAPDAPEDDDFPSVVSSRSMELLPIRISVRSNLSSLSSELRVMHRGTGSTELPMVQHCISFNRQRIADITRGIPVARSLRNFGKLWKKSPLELDPISQNELWEKGENVESFDVFFSHTWRTPGSQKFLSLLFQYGWRTVMASCGCSVMLVFLLGAFGVLPMTSLTWPVDVLDFKVFCPFAPWSYLTGTLTLQVSLFLYPYCSCKSPKCFLDVVSIHQTSKSAKMRGIYGLGGFLSISDEMRVLWSPPYLTRLWCVFELAAFRKANPTKPLNLKPLFVESQVYVLMVASGVCTGIYIGIRTGHGIVLLANLAMLPLVFLVHANRKLMREEKTLKESLESFDLNKVECHSEADRAFVSMAISAWYGSEESFTEYVRGPLREELLAAREDLPLYYGLLVATSPLCMVIDIAVAMIRVGAPLDAVLAEFIGLGLGVTFFWNALCVKVVWSLSSRWAAPCSTLASDFLPSLLIFVIFILLLGGCSAVMNNLLPVSKAAGIGLGIAVSIIVVIAYVFPAKCQGHSQRSLPS